MAAQWAPGLLHSKRNIRVFLFQEVLVALVVDSLGASEYGHYTAQAHARKSVKLFSFVEGRSLVTGRFPW